MNICRLLAVVVAGMSVWTVQLSRGEEPQRSKNTKSAEQRACKKSCVS